MRPDIRGAAGVRHPEEGRIVRAAVVERLVASGADRLAAERLAEASYRRVLNAIEAQLRRGEDSPGARRRAPRLVE